MNDKLSHLKKLYEDGYRCIYYDSANENTFSVYLKNFEIEQSEVVELQDPTEFNELRSYIDGFNFK